MRKLLDKIKYFFLDKKKNNYFSQYESLKQEYEKQKKINKEYKDKSSPMGKFSALELKAWIKNPTTKKMVIIFKKKRMEIANNLVKGNYKEADIIKMIGLCEGIRIVIEKMEHFSNDPQQFEEILNLYLLNILNEEI